MQLAESVLLAVHVIENYWIIIKPSWLLKGRVILRSSSVSV